MILAVTGTNGSGKGTVHEYLKTKGFTHYSARDLIVEEIQKQGLVVNRDTLNRIGNELRKKHGPDHVAHTLYERALQQGGDAVIESIRAIGEALFLKERGVKLIAVDADRKMRYARAVLRASETDRVSFEEFVEQENRELAQTADYDMNIQGVMALADFTIQNDGSLEDFHQALDGIVDELKTREA